MEHFSPIVRHCIEACFTICFSTTGRPQLATARPTDPSDWGFNAQALQATARAADWSDHELIGFLTYGCYDYSPNAPPISWFAPQSASVFKQWNSFADSMEKEIRMGWMTGPYDSIPTVPFRVVPGTAIPKPRQPTKFRTIWNASVPSPELLGSAVSNCSGMELPVASSTAAILPPYLAIAWMSIERVCVSLHVLAQVSIATGTQICGLGRNYAHWFIMFHMAQPKHWKSCVFFRNAFYVDVQAQMGRVASAHLVLRTSFLVNALSMQRAACEFEQRLNNGTVPKPIAIWARQRQEHNNIMQMMPLLFLIFQDDILELVLGHIS